MSEKAALGQHTAVGDIGAFKAEQEPQYLESEHGRVMYVIQGSVVYPEQPDVTKTAIVTYHDLGLDYRSCFQAFLSFPCITEILESFCFVHIHAPGQEPGSVDLPKDFVYPNLDQLADQVLDVVDHLNITDWLGIGAGVGGNILLRAALNSERREKLRGLLLVGVNPKQVGWWEYMMYNIGCLQLPFQKQVGEYLQEILVNQYFSNFTTEYHIDLVEAVRKHLVANAKPMNLYKFMTVCLRRNNVLARLKKDRITCPVMLVTGSDSVHYEDILELNGLLDSSKTSFLDVRRCGNLVTEENPREVMRAFVLFLQGVGLGVGAVLRMNQLFQKEFTSSAPRATAATTVAHSLT